MLAEFQRPFTGTVQRSYKPALAALGLIAICALMTARVPMKLLHYWHAPNSERLSLSVPEVKTEQATFVAAVPESSAWRDDRADGNPPYLLKVRPGMQSNEVPTLLLLRTLFGLRVDRDSSGSSALTAQNSNQ